MSPIYAGVLGILILLFLFAIRVPVAFAMGIMGFLGFTYLGSVSSALEMVAVEFFDVFSSYTLTVLPMFVLMGAIAFRMGMSNRIFDSTYVILGNRKGGLAIASILGCAAFAAICGSTNATAAAMGSVALYKNTLFTILLDRFLKNAQRGSNLSHHTRSSNWWLLHGWSCNDYAYCSNPSSCSHLFGV